MRWVSKKDYPPNKKKLEKKRLPSFTDGETEAPSMYVIHPRPQLMKELGFELRYPTFKVTHTTNALQLFLDTQVPLWEHVMGVWQAHLCAHL